MQLTKEQIDFVNSLRDADGNIEDDDLIEASRSTNSPTHEFFGGFNESTAALAHWRSVARNIIYSVRYAPSKTIRTTVTAPVYVASPNRKRGERTRIALNTVAKHEEQSRMLLVAELTRVRNALGRAAVIAEKLNVVDLARELSSCLERINKIDISAAPPKRSPKRSSRRSEARPTA